MTTKRNRHSNTASCVSVRQLRGSARSYFFFHLLVSSICFVSSPDEIHAKHTPLWKPLKHFSNLYVHKEFPADHPQVYLELALPVPDAARCSSCSALLCPGLLTLQTAFLRWQTCSLTGGFISWFSLLPPSVPCMAVLDCCGFIVQNHLTVNHQGCMDVLVELHWHNCIHICSLFHQQFQLIHNQSTTTFWEMLVGLDRNGFRGAAGY